MSKSIDILRSRRRHASETVESVARDRGPSADSHAEPARAAPLRAVPAETRRRAVRSYYRPRRCGVSRLDRRSSLNRRQIRDQHGRIRRSPLPPPPFKHQPPTGVPPAPASVNQKRRNKCERRPTKRGVKGEQLKSVTMADLQLRASSARSGAPLRPTRQLPPAQGRDPLIGGSARAE